MFKLRKYHGNRVQSLTYEENGEAASVGIMSPGEYEFGAIEKETTTVCSGEIAVKVEDETGWQTYKQGETFVVPPHASFRMKVSGVSTYFCKYGD